MTEIDPIIGMAVQESYTPLWQPTAKRGKFYAAIIVRMDTQDAAYWVPVYNWGPGRADGFTTGQLTVGDVCSIYTYANSYATSKIRVKQNAGYSQDYAARGVSEVVPDRVRDYLTNRFNPPSANAVNTAALTTVVESIEATATEILGLRAINPSLERLTSLRADVDSLRTHFHRAESALELAETAVRSRLA